MVWYSRCDTSSDTILGDVCEGIGALDILDSVGVCDKVRNSFLLGLGVKERVWSEDGVSTLAVATD